MGLKQNVEETRKRNSQNKIIPVTTSARAMNLQYLLSVQVFLSVYLEA